MTCLEETWLDKTHIDSEIKRLKWTQYGPIKIVIRTQIPKIKTATQTIWNPTKNSTKIAQEQLNKMHRLEIPNSTPIQNKKLKQQDNMETRWTTRK